MKHFYSLIALLVISSVAFGQDCSTGRYSTAVFTDVDSSMNVKYGANLDQDDQNTEDLFMDIYYPKNDPSTSRALIILAHGGSFIGGDKADLASLCKMYAQLGYTAATINYRLLTVNATVIGNPGPEFKKEVVRALHDMKAAVRFFRRSVAEDGNPYGIDPNIIIVGGESAGAITSNHVSYLDEVSEIPADLVNFVNTHGGLEGTSGNPGYSSSPQLDVSMCGAINDTSWMTAGSIPYVGIHTDGDPVVPNLFGQPNIGMVIPVDLYGDSLMYEQAVNVGIPSDYQMYISNDHCGFPEPDANIFIKTFLHDQICNQNLSVHQNSDFQFKMYPNPTSDKLVINFKDQDLHSIVQIFNTAGKLVSTSLLKQGENQITLNVSSLKAGAYFIRVTNEKGQMAMQKFIKK